MLMHEYNVYAELTSLQASVLTAALQQGELHLISVSEHDAFIEKC